MLWLMLLATAPSFVTGDLVNLRDAPKDGAVIVRLRIDTPVKVHRTIGANADVSIDTPTRTLRGFVPSNLISTERETVDALVSKLENAATQVDAHFYAARLLALDPTEARASYLREKLPGVSNDILARSDARPTLLAVCEANEYEDVPASYAARVILLGAIEKGDLVPREVDDETRTQIEASPWFVVGQHQPLDGSPFLGVNARMSWNEGREFDAPNDMSGNPQLVLGPCDEPGTIYATREMFAVPTEKASKKETLGAGSGPVTWLLGHGALVPFGEIAVDVEYHENPDVAEGVLHNRDVVIGERAIAGEGAPQEGYQARSIGWFSFSPKGDRMGLIEIEASSPEGASSLSVSLIGVTPEGAVEPRGTVDIANGGC